MVQRSEDGFKEAEEKGTIRVGGDDTIHLQDESLCLRNQGVETLRNGTATN